MVSSQSKINGEKQQEAESEQRKRFGIRHLKIKAVATEKWKQYYKNIFSLPNAMPYTQAESEYP